MNIDFSKGNGLVPAIIQDADTNIVLMLGYMNEEAFHKTKQTKKVTFYSRTRNKIWTKGETSGNFLFVRSILIDCDNDTLLIKAEPQGPICHTGTDTCFNEKNMTQNSFLQKLEKIIDERKNIFTETSYTASLYAKGINKIAQKVGEEAVEAVIEAINDNIPLLKEELADLVYHILVLLHHKNLSFKDIVDILETRHTKT